MSDINSAILERLEKVVDSLQENSVRMGQLLAVHNEKLSKQDQSHEELGQVRSWNFSANLDPCILRECIADDLADQ